LGIGLSNAVHAQPAANRATPQPAGPELTTKLGLIDMGFLFNEYQRFKDLRETLKSEIQKSDEQAKAMAEQIQALGKQLQSDSIKKGSPDYERIETSAVKMQTEFNVFRQKAQRDFIKKESEIYKTVYLEVSATVEQYAKFYKYTTILRFSRDKVDDTDDPRQLIQNMNNQIIFHDKSIDITDQVLRYLNDKYQQTKPAGAPNNAAAAPNGNLIK
jgi:outer membrane protein